MTRLPDFLIIGAQKAGTTAAARNMCLHPALSVYNGVTEYSQKEIEYFNQHWHRGTDWYASHFQEMHTQLVGEKTAELLHRLACHQRIQLTLPSVKLLVFLRCPLERAFSQWKMAHFIKRDEPREFSAVIHDSLKDIGDLQAQANFYNAIPDDTLSNWREGYLLRGLYDDQLRHLYGWFAPERVHITISERVRRHPRQAYSAIFSFLGVDMCDLPFAEHFVSPQAPPMDPMIRATLRELYKEPNERLFCLLGEEVPEWQ